MSPWSPVSSPSWAALALYLKYWRQFPWLTFGSVMFSLCRGLRATITPLLIALTLGQLIHEHSINVGLLVLTGCFELGIVFLSFLLDTYCVAVLHNRVAEAIYDDCFVYLSHQDYAFFTDNFSGSLVTQASRFAKVYTTFNDVVLFELLPQLTVVLVSVGVMAYYSPIIGLVTLLMWIFVEALVVKFALLRLPIRRGAIAKETEQIGELADTITNALTVKTFAAEDREIERYQRINVARGKLFIFAWRRAVRNGWIIDSFCAVLQMVVFAGGIVAVYHGSIGIATFLLFQVYILRIIDNMHRSTFMVRQFEAVAGDGQEMAELLNQAPLVQDKASPEKSQISRGAIDFKSMTFNYHDANNDDVLFSDFGLQIKSGEKIGLVGPSGGGKTTITRLLLRFMDVQGGAIVIDGQDIRDIKQQDLRRAIAYVPQEPLLFHRSIKENISYGKPGAKDSEVIAVAKKSFAHEFISHLPQGYDTLVGERGVKLSGGQRQRVAIARAMLTNAPILILDEATSALDSESERLIQKALWQLMKDKTAVVIAHRLSTIQRMDRIVVVDEGKIIEQGSHDSLLKKNGLYAKLWSHQSGGFIED
ncbi:MAG: ABC transporter ATP-binding protein [Patescibacteria group bacterium]